MHTRKYKMQHFKYQKETTQMVIYANNSLNVYIHTDRQTSLCKYGDKDTTLYQAILKPQTPLMLRNPGFLSFPARRRLFKVRGRWRKERQRPEAAERAGAIWRSAEVQSCCNPVSGWQWTTYKELQEGIKQVNVTKSTHLWTLSPRLYFPFIVCTQSNWGLDLWPLTCQVLRRMMCDPFDFRVVRTTSCTLMAINTNHGKMDFIAFPHLQLPPACRCPLTLEAARITENEITLAYTRLVLLLTLAGCFFSLPRKPRNTDLHS